MKKMVLKTLRLCAFAREPFFWLSDKSGFPLRFNPAQAGSPLHYDRLVRVGENKLDTYSSGGPDGIMQAKINGSFPAFRI